MKRSVTSLLIVGLHLIILTIALRIPVAAESRQQTIPPADDTAPVPATPLQISVRQQVPLALTIQHAVAATGTLTATTTLTETIGVTLDLSFDVTLTDSVTATVPTTVVITFADAQTTTVPLSLTVTVTPSAAIVITPLLPIADTTPLTSTEALTATGSLTATTGLTEEVSLTPTVGITASVPPQVLNPTVVSTVAITANLRSGPDTTFDIQTTATPGQSIVVVAQNADGTWYLINNGLWIAAFLVDNPPASLPVATEDLVTTLREQNPITPTVPLNVGGTITTTVAEPTTPPGETEATAEPDLPTLVPTPTPTTPVTTTAVVSPTTDAATDTGDTGDTAQAPATNAEPPTVTVDANLREGPGTAFPVIGGTVTGQALTIVARNDDGSWFRLDNGGWLAAFLVANAPDPATIPIFDENAPAAATPAPTAALTPTVPLTPTFGVQEN
ncbi:MAG: hypothetical protein KDE53_08820, partial [Caldilineaceae bacterium]|nr:hypothetical protein [Caldilineaceae bacterium]